MSGKGPNRLRLVRKIEPSSGVGLNMTEADWLRLFTTYGAELEMKGRALCVAGAMVYAFWDYH